jgi:hemoglobin
VVVTAFERLGGEEGIRRLVDRFYDVMDTHPEARPIRLLHPTDLSESRRKLWMFLVGRFGGPQIYVQERGHPMLRARHMPFPIGPAEASQWVLCMDTALNELVPDEPFRKELREFFRMVAEHMHNQQVVE